MFHADTNESKLRRRTGEKWKHYPADVLPAWVADMDFEIAPPIRAALDERLANVDLGYPMLERRSGLHEMFAERIASRFGWQIDPVVVEVLNDVVQGIYMCLQTLSAEGEGAVIQTPIYPPFLRAVDLTRRRGILCPLEAGKSRFEIDFDRLESALDSSTRLILLCNPHNPTGRAFDREELERLAAIACRHDLVIVADEIHADLVLDDRPHIPIATLDAEVAQRTVTLMSASKAFNIAGLCLAFAVIENDALRRRFKAMPPHTRGGLNTLSMAAVRAAWTQSQPWLDEALNYLRDNRDHFADYCRAQWPDIVHFPPEATYLAWLDMRALTLKPSPYEFFLEKARVALSDGRRFGEAGTGFVRLNFATSQALLDEILERMNEALKAR
ncbi:MAG: PatB family C-S lyase [Pseudomonadota bacterium]|nr:PatB family C-S lyase [Pseudomonadota bacterium]